MSTTESGKKRKKIIANDFQDDLIENIRFMPAQDYLQNRLNAQIEWHDAKSIYHQQMYKKLKAYEFILAASVPVLVSMSTMGIFENARLFKVDAYQVNLSIFMQIIASLAGVLIVVLNKTAELGEHYKHWKDYRDTCERLRQEQLLFLTRTEPYDYNGAFPVLVQNVEEIINNQIQRWRTEPKNKQADEVVKKALASLDSLYGVKIPSTEEEPEEEPEEDEIPMHSEPQLLHPEPDQEPTDYYSPPTIPDDTKPEDKKEQPNEDEALG